MKYKVRSISIKQIIQWIKNGGKVIEPKIEAGYYDWRKLVK